MADDGASSSNKSVEKVEEQKEHPLQVPSSFSNTNDSCTSVTSSSHMASPNPVFLLSKDSSSAASNPFAVKSSTSTRPDSTDNKEARPLLAPPTFKLTAAETPKIVLRPSALSVQAEKLKLLNKHDGCTKQDGKENSSDESNNAKSTNLSETNGKMSTSEEALGMCAGSSSEASTTLSSPSKPSSTADNPFSLAAKASEEESSNGGFVFGQNLHERVVNYDEGAVQPTHSPTEAPKLTFEEAALKKEELEKLEKENQEAEKMKKSLSESAKEYESKQVKRKFDQVAVITGEEEECNVVQINCKLFAFDEVTTNWLERGRGLLRLNDKEIKGEMHSRVVMRTHGSLRVVLNTKVWSGMTIEHPSSKTVRLTGYDLQGVKVFLVMTQPQDADKLFQALSCRVASLKTNDAQDSKKARCESTTNDPQSSGDFPPDDDSSSVDAAEETPTRRCDAAITFKKSDDAVCDSTT